LEHEPVCVGALGPHRAVPVRNRRVAKGIVGVTLQAFAAPAQDERYIAMGIQMITKVTHPSLPPEQDLIGAFSEYVRSPDVPKAVPLFDRFPIVVRNQ
jgi:hypothetical protein